MQSQAISLMLAFVGAILEFSIYHVSAGGHDLLRALPILATQPGLTAG